MDPISTATPDEQQALALSGAVSLQDVQYSVLLPTILDKIIRTKGKEWFALADYDAIEGEAKRIFTEAHPAPVNITP
jgi:hypothetical protein